MSYNTKKKAIFLDRDGTINIDKNYLYRKEDFEFLPGTMKALKQLQSLGYILVIITNQSGIGRGYYSEDDLNKLNTWLIQIFKENGIHIKDILYCPHHPKAVISKYKMLCECRKPGIKLFEKAIQKYNIDLDRSYAIGDRERDLSICNSSKCQGILLADKKDRNINEAYFQCSSLLEAADYIKSREEEKRI